MSHPLDGKGGHTPNPDKKTVNVPEHHLHRNIRPDTAFDKMIHERGDAIRDEILAGFHAVAEYPKSVTFFGSARLSEDHKYYKDAEELASKICAKGYAVITGGGPGIMEAANKGSKNTCNSSVGFNIELPDEQIINPYVTHGLNFNYFSSRKLSLYFSAETYIYYPGGYGTLDEFFGLITMIQTGKAPKTPIVLVGSDFWCKLNEFVCETLTTNYETISHEDSHLYQICDDHDEILKIIEEAPERSEYGQL